MLGFTRREESVLLFLVVSFVVGMGVKFYRSYWAPLPALVAEKNISLSSIEKNAGEGEGRGVKTKITTRKVFLNTATQEDLERLPGIGPVTAGRIIEYRREKGFFSSLEELTKVKGVGQKTVEKLKPYLKLKGRKTNGRKTKR